MAKFQAKYKVPADIDGTAEKARSKGLPITPCEGHAKGPHPPRGQLVIRLPALDAKALVSRNTVQVFWSNYENIDQIERNLREIIVTRDGSQADIRGETRIAVPTIREAKEHEKLVLEILSIQEEKRIPVTHLQDLLTELERHKLIEEILSTQEKRERHERLKEAIYEAEEVIELWEQQPLSVRPSPERIQEIRELIARAKREASI